MISHSLIRNDSPFLRADDEEYEADQKFLKQFHLTDEEILRGSAQVLYEDESTQQPFQRPEVISAHGENFELFDRPLDEIQMNPAERERKLELQAKESKNIKLQQKQQVSILRQYQYTRNEKEILESQRSQPGGYQPSVVDLSVIQSHRGKTAPQLSVHHEKKSSWNILKMFK